LFQFDIRLLHPLSPRGKLVHWGREGLEATNRLVDIAQAASDAAAAAKTKDGSTSPLQSPDQPQIVVRDQLYRLAVTQHHVDQFQATAQKLPEYCTWWTADQLVQAGIVGVESTVEAIAATSPEAEASATVLGGLRLHNGCRVVHVPSYLQGLYAACRERGATWQVVGADDCSYEHWKHRLQDFDAVVLSAGSGLFFQDEYTTDGSNTDSLLSRKNFPVQMVRGQSVELRVPGNDDVNSANTSCPSQAILCGKYISPMPNDPTLYTVGATHEFKEDALSPQEVVEELTKRTADFSSLWELASVERMTMGYRVQSNRGQYGRMPVIGQLPAASVANGDGAAPIHTNTWIFTGLSSRGLLFHALYGDILTDAILEGSEASMLSRCKDLTWWRK
jgi:glycine/D-amino acid oxidase-like deaminating enzyme